MKLSDIVSFNSEFRNAINLYLNLNKADKIRSYIPTKSSVDILKQYIDAVENNKRQATILIGPYGKGKSHLLLVLLAIISLERNKKNNEIINELVERIKRVDEQTSNIILNIWNKKGRFLPVILMSSQGDLNQSFLVGLNDALKREGLSELAPETFYTHAVDVIKRWKKDYPDTYTMYKKLIKAKKISENDMLNGLVNCENDKLELFKKIYPELTAGGIFNPLASAEVLPMYKSVADKLKEQYGFSGIYIIFDEFSKFIEGQNKKTTGNNMKLLQDICELANDSKDAQVFITMVAHKSIKEYGKYLSTETINSFTGIEGRIEEVFFTTSSKNNYELIKNAIFKDEDNLVNVPEIKPYINDDRATRYFKLDCFRSTFTKEDFKEILVKGCYPLSPSSAYLLLNISEKVAQNERTLFTFISKDEQHSMARYVKTHPNKNNKDWIINADLIYDYFKAIFKKDITNEYVHNEWLNAEYALSMVKDADEIKLIKTIAIINIVNKPDEISTNQEHLELASGLDNVIDIIDKLVTSNVIYRKSSNDSYVFKTRATSEIKTEIRNRRAIKGDKVNIGNVLSSICELKYILPKRYNYEYTMTRFFRYEFMEVQDFLNIIDYNVFFDKNKFADGLVLALFSLTDKDYSKKIKEKIHDFQCPRLVVLYNSNVFKLSSQAQEYEIIQELKSDTKYFESDDKKVLLKELPILEEDIRIELYNFIDINYGDESANIFYYSKNKAHTTNEINISKVVDDLCYEIYNKSISINNELINKEYVNTSPIKKARKIIIEDLINNNDTSKYMQGTSAEATIYRALFVGTGIKSGHYKKNIEYVLGIFNEYLDNCGINRAPVSELINKLTDEPIGMRSGVIPIYLAYTLSKRNEDIVVYFEKKEVEISPDIILNMCEQPNDYYIYISLEDVNKEKYISSLCNMFNVNDRKLHVDSRIHNIFSNIQRWYRSLPQVTKNIRNQSKYIDNKVLEKALPKLKNIMQSVEANPYEALFENIPLALGIDNNYDEVIKLLGILKEKLGKYYEWLLAKTAKQTIKLFDNTSKQDLCHTLYEWYETQSDLAKNGLHAANITGFMNCINKNKIFDDSEFVKKIVKAITGVYIDSWNDSSLDKYLEELSQVKAEIESINDEVKVSNQYELSFTNKSGVVIKKYYNQVDENTGVILRNMISDNLEDNSDLSANDKVAILLEMIEKVLE